MSKRWRLTRTSLDKLPKVERETLFFDDVLTGFGVRVTPTGRKTFIAQGRVRGHGAKVRRVVLGQYPRMTPELARREAQTALNSMSLGRVPGTEPAERITVSDLLDKWLETEVDTKRKPRTASDYRRIADQAIKPAFGTKRVVDVVREDIAALHHAKRATPRRANYIVAVAKSFLTYAEDAGVRPMNSNPARRLKPFRENRRERFLSADELRRAAAAIEAAECQGVISLFAAAGLRLCLLTGARSGEITALRWKEVDLELRLLLLETSKTGRKPIYLSQPAVDILAGLPRVVGNPFVIAGGRTMLDDHENTAEPYKNLGRAWIKVRATAGLDDVRLHDLRHTFASVAAGESVSLQMIGGLLGHTVPATTARYAHLAADPLREANERVAARMIEHINKPDADGSK